jgi:hypothetical protein
MTNRTVAQLFGDLIASGNDSAASSLLSKEMQSSTSPISPMAITAAAASMTAYASSQIQGAEVMKDFTLISTEYGQ